MILASDFQRVQVIPNPLNESHLEVSGITCCSDLGKVRASDNTDSIIHLLYKIFDLVKLVKFLHIFHV